MLDRIAQIVLVVFGALLLVLLVLGLAVSCRGTSAETPSGSTATVVIDSSIPGYPGPGTIVAPPPTPILFVTPTPSVTPPTTGPVAATATQSPATTPPDTTVVPGATSASPAGGSSGWIPGSTVRHVVVRGEWLLQIARCYGVAYESLRAANQVPYPDYILPGAILTIPNIGSQGAIVGSPCVVAYTVTAADTWESLAQRYGTTVAILKRANPGALAVGRSIWVPRTP